MRKHCKVNKIIANFVIPRCIGVETNGEKNPITKLLLQRREKKGEQKCSFVFRFYGPRSSAWFFFRYLRRNINKTLKFFQEWNRVMPMLSQRENWMKKRKIWEYFYLIYVPTHSGGASRHACGGQSVRSDVISSEIPFSVLTSLCIGHPLDIKMSCGLNKIEFQFDIYLSVAIHPKHCRKLFSNPCGDSKRLS